MIESATAANDLSLRSYFQVLTRLLGEPRRFFGGYPAGIRLETAAGIFDSVEPFFHGRRHHGEPPSKIGCNGRYILYQCSRHAPCDRRSRLYGNASHNGTTGQIQTVFQCICAIIGGYPACLLDPFFPGVQRALEVVADCNGHGQRIWLQMDTGPADYRAFGRHLAVAFLDRPAVDHSRRWISELVAWLMTIILWSKKSRRHSAWQEKLKY